MTRAGSEEDVIGVKEVSSSLTTLALAYKGKISYLQTYIDHALKAKVDSTVVTTKLESEKEQLEKELGEVKEEITSLKTQNAEHEDDKKDLLEEIIKMQKKIEELKKDKEGSQKLDELTLAQRDIDIKVLKRRITELTKEKTLVIRNHNAAKKETEKVVKEKDELIEQKEELEEQKDELTQRMKELEGQKEILEKEKAEIKDTVKEMEDQIKLLKEKKDAHEIGDVDQEE